MTKLMEEILKISKSNYIPEGFEDRKDDVVDLFVEAVANSSGYTDLYGYMVEENKVAKIERVLNEADGQSPSSKIPEEIRNIFGPSLSPGDRRRMAERGFSYGEDDVPYQYRNLPDSVKNTFGSNADSNPPVPGSATNNFFSKTRDFFVGLGQNIKAFVSGGMKFVVENPIPVIAGIALAGLVVAGTVALKKKIEKGKAEDMLRDINKKRKEKGLALISKNVISNPKKFLEDNKDKIKKYGTKAQLKKLIAQAKEKISDTGKSIKKGASDLMDKGKEMLSNLTKKKKQTA